MKTWADLGIDTRGHTHGEHKTLCPQCSSQRKKSRIPCLNINLDEGLFNCWHCGWSGSLKAGEWDRPQIVRTWTRPAYTPKTPEAQMLDWFASRGITKAVVERNRICLGKVYFPQVEEERGCVQFPFFRDGQVVNIKYRTRDKLFRMHGGAERVPYGLDDIDPECLIWVEGEMDKLAVEVAGFKSCVSVPDGAPAPDSKTYGSKFDFLADAKIASVQKHIIAVDADAPGVRLKEELIRRLGSEKCFVVTWPEDCKDANDVLLKHDSERLWECIDKAQEVPILGTFRVSDFLTEMVDHYEHGSPQGVSTGWDRVDEHYRVMPGEWTLVTGIPGHGKSEWLDALCLNLAREHGWSFGMFSPENLPMSYHAEKMAEKYTGKPFRAGPTERMTPKERDQAMAWLDQYMTFVLPDNPTVEVLLEVARGLVRQRGIRGFVIDPWNEIDHSRVASLTETEYISQSLSKVRKFSRETGTHVWVVAHPTKLQKEASGKYPVPTPYDVSGSAHWRNKADNCITVFREEDRVGIHVQKIRKKANGKVGLIEMKYDILTGQYREIPKEYGPRVKLREVPRNFREKEDAA